MIKAQQSLAVVFYILLSLGAYVFAQVESDHIPLQAKKRDPFVALVNPNGKIKSGDELFPIVKKKSFSMNIILKAIIWDEQRPLAMINNKIYSEGKEIAEGLVLEKINPNNIVLNDNGSQVTIPLRKSGKNE